MTVIIFIFMAAICVQGFFDSLPCSCQGKDEDCIACRTAVLYP